MEYYKRIMKNWTGQRRFREWPIVSDQVGEGELGVVWRELEKVLDAGVPGDVVEFGCFVGTTSLFIRRLLDEKGQSGKRAFHVYDSFEGLPTKTRQDESTVGAAFQGGELKASKKDFVRQFQAAHLQPPIIHKNWFNKLADTDVPATIAFAFLDGDFYQSIMDSLKLVWPRMSPGGIVLIDDYGREALPGATRAVHDFFGSQSLPMQQQNIAIIRA